VRAFRPISYEGARLYATELRFKKQAPKAEYASAKGA